jgi:hypothetical protein
MPNAIFELAHGTPAHENFRNPAARDLLPGELDFNVTTGFVAIADRGAKAGKEWAGIVQDGAAVLRVKNPAYNAGGSNAITQNLGAKVYIDKTTVGSAWDAVTNPYGTIVFANSASSLFLGVVSDFPVRLTEEFINIRFTAKAPVVPGAAAT